VNPEEIRQKLHVSPFILFRVDTSDEKHLDVMQPEMTMLTRMALLIALPVADPARNSCSLRLRLAAAYSSS
jgi:hypothetical protein